MTPLRRYAALVLAFAAATGPGLAEDRTYAERLGWGPEDRVVIFHVDDVGMSYESNVGAIESLEKGVATSWSIMMPCPWVPGIARYLKEHPQVDAGLHLTMTSEWDDYRWGPCAGKSVVPGLADEQDCLWDNVRLVIANASADEIEKEIRAQIDRAEKLGIPITHMDSHMGTLFANPAYFERYVKVGIEKQIPILIAGGHMQHAGKESGVAARLLLRPWAEKVWKAGLPVLDDLHTDTYGWGPENETENVIELLRDLRPGLTEILVHCAKNSEHFDKITSSSARRDADLKAMIDPRVRRVIKEKGIILTTWRELKKRRDAVGK